MHVQGYYWPVKGPGNTLYVPGPLLKDCRNDVILLEIDAAPANFTGILAILMVPCHCLLILHCSHVQGSFCTRCISGQGFNTTSTKSSNFMQLCNQDCLVQALF